MSTLNNLKILDFTTLIPGPFATMMMGDMGADIIKVESPTRLDLVRAMGPFNHGSSTSHSFVNRNKRSISLDLKKQKSIEIIKRLILDFDIIIEQFRPGVMKRLGLDYESLKTINSNIIYCSITGYGQTGPYKDKAGHDNNYLSISGTNGYSGKVNQPSPIMGLPIADLAGGSLHAVIGILAAVNHRNNKGSGQHIDVSMTDSMFAMNGIFGSQFLAAGQELAHETTHINGGSFYGYYQTKDDKTISVGSLEPKFLMKLCAGLEISDHIGSAISNNTRQQSKFKDLVAKKIREKDMSHWEKVFENEDACVEPVISFQEACENTQILAREMITSVSHLEGGEENQVSSAIKFSDSKARYDYCGVPIGFHTKEVLKEINFSDAEIESMINNNEIQ